MHNFKFAFLVIAALISSNYLDFALEINFKIDERAKNVALLQESMQSSLSDILGPPNLAVDENRETCSRTGTEKEVTWSVALDKKYPIAGLLIKSETFFGPNQEIYIGYNLTTRGNLCNYGSQHDDAINDHNITCLTGPMMGSVVTIKNSLPGGLRLCDVRVLVCEDGYFGSLCVQTCHCDEGKSCDRISGECPGLCGSGWMGKDCQSECKEGTFGPSCESICHCEVGANCSATDGSCDGDCHVDWIGPSCQTAIPKLTEAPTYVQSHISEISIKWPAWNSPLDASISLFYLVEYKHGTQLGNDSVGWTIATGIEPAEVDGDVISAVVSDLRRNTYYEFRVVPMLKMSEVGSEIRGGPSPPSAPFKTKCNAPMAPNITSLHSWYGSQGATITIHWTPLTKSQSNCDDINHYEILYQKLGETTWKTEFSTASSKNITGLDYDSDYLFVVVAHNNQPLDASSSRKSFTTVAEVRALQSLEKPIADVGVILGAVFCSVLVIALAFVLFIYKRQMKKYNSIPQQELEGKIEAGIRSTGDNHRNHSPTGNVNPSSSPNDLDDQAFDYGDDVTFAPDPPFRQSKHFLHENGRVAGKPREIPTPTIPPERQPIAVKELEDYIIKGKDNDCQLFRKEFKEIPDANLEATTACGLKTENRYKNRFINILPYDHSRVVLEKNGTGDCSDYINASYIDGYKKSKAYIASQGCNKWTLQDMWRMVWQADTRRIVMVTNLIEKGKVKCEQYWSDGEHDEIFYGSVGVTLVDVEKTTDYVIRTFNVRLKDGNGDPSKGFSRIVKQFHYVAWPDHGVPDRASPIIAFRRKVRLHDVSHPGVILIHCSAGVGRTGAFIAIDYLLDAVQVEESIDVYNYACSMRKDRVNMIQTLDQYVFVYDALLEAIKIGDTIITSASFSAKYQSMLSTDESGISDLEKEFQLLDSVSYKGRPEDYALGNIPENVEKNRFPEILPADKYRPYLMTRVQGTNDYINAVYLDGYRSKNAYISTQMPMTHTVIDLWRLVHELQCGTVVMLNSWDEHDDTYGQYWSEENEECECGPFMIEATSINRDNPDVTVRELKLTFTPPPLQASPTPKNNNNNNEVGEKPPTSNVNSSQTKQQQQHLTVNHFQLNLSWPDDSKESDLTSSTPLKVAVISLLDMVEKSQMKTGNRSIVVHCRDGVTHSGLFVAVGCIIERLKDEQEVEVFQAVRKLRDRRPNVVRDFRQYKFCYDMVLAYLTEFSIYSNFK